MDPVARSRAPAIEFPSLPTELGLLIWNETFEPRILHITYQKFTFYQSMRRNSRGISYTHIRFKSRKKPPIALQICHESRTLALKHYAPSFHSKTSPLSRASEVNQTAIYFNPELDTVHIVDDGRVDALSILTNRTDKETIHSIKTLAVAFQGSISQAENTLSRNLPALEQLETFILVIEEEAESARKKIGDIVIKAKDRLRVRGMCGEWKMPVVKVMDPAAFESHS